MVETQSQSKHFKWIKFDVNVGGGYLHDVALDKVVNEME